MIKSSILIFVIWSGVNQKVASQQDSISFNFNGYDFVKDEENVITNLESLAPFFERLYQLRTAHEGRVNIVQIGDSHIQADYLSGTVRDFIQKDFGNAGRGLVVPGRVANTNEPPNIRSSSRFSWEAKRVVHAELPLPIGIGGITIQTRQPGASFTIKTAEGYSDHRFDRVTLFYQKDRQSFNIVIKDSLQQELAYAGPYEEQVFPFTSSVTLPYPSNQITVETSAPTSESNHFTLFGVNLENRHPGVLYHALGVNGAKFKHYLSAKEFVKQTEALNPELIILSLGTNEALDYPYVDAKLAEYIHEFVTRLKAANPGAQFLFTVPPDSFRRKTRRNPGVDAVRETIIKYANDHNIAYWDLYGASGGQHSADNYKKAGLLRTDGIHFTKEGYQLQGSMFYSALTKAYNLYVQYRHP